MPPLIDLTRAGPFGRLRVLGRAANDRHGKSQWECLCDPELGGCGQTTVVTGANLRSGHTESCGCLHREAASAALAAERHRRPSSEPHIPRDRKLVCVWCRCPLVGRHNAQYHPACYRASRTVKRLEQRAGTAEQQAAKLAAELEARRE